MVLCVAFGCTNPSGTANRTKKLSFFKKMNESRNVTLEMDELKTNIDELFLLVNAVFVSLMQAGFACLEAGSVRTKNSVNILMKNLLDLFICAIAYYLVGFALAYGNGSPYVGLTIWAGIGLEETKLAYWFFQFIFAATAATIISGAVAERCNFVAYIVYSALISGVFYPIVSHWAWHDEGWLKNLGYLDFAGSGVVHALAGICSFVAAAFIGPRKGRFGRGKIYDMPGHSLPLVGLGALLLVSGFLAFNGGSLGHISQPGDGAIVARSMVSTVVAGSGGGVAALILGRSGIISQAPWPFSFTLNAILAGMVSICGGPETYATWASFVIGVFGCFIYFGLHHVVLALRVDDPLDAGALHFGAGAWGVIARPIFAEDGLVFGNNAFKQLLINIGGLTAIIAWSVVTSCALFGGLKSIGFLRVSEEEEAKGLDLAKHGEISYPPQAWNWTNELDHQIENGASAYKSPRNDYDNHAFQMERKHNHRL